jgi:hypothetical protein
MPNCPVQEKRMRTYEGAIAAAIRLSRHNVPLRIYPCPDCGTWHVTKRSSYQERRQSGRHQRAHQAV